MRWMARKSVPVCVIAIFLIGIWGCAENVYTSDAASESFKEISFCLEALDSWSNVRNGVRNISEIPQDRTYRMEGCDSDLYMYAFAIPEIKSKLSFEAPEATTRGLPIGSVDDFESSISSFKVAAEVGSSLYMEREIQRADSWTTGASKYYWPSNEHTVKFYAYAPASATGLSNVSRTAGNQYSFNYTVPSNVTSQNDLMLAKKTYEGRPDDGKCELSFTHALTAIQFAIGNMIGYKIVNVTISGVYGSGSYDGSSDQWTPTGEKTSFSIDLNYDVADGSSNLYITSGQTTMMMIPQKLDNGVTISVMLEYTDPDTGYPFHTTIRKEDMNIDWKSGETIVYKLSSSSLNTMFTVTPPDNFAYNDTKSTKKNFTVSSASWVGKGQYTALGWTAQFVDDAGNAMTPAGNWVELSGYSYADRGDITTSSYTVAVAAQSKDASITNQKGYLSRASNYKGSSSDPYDLSIEKLKSEASNPVSDNQNTSNCYIVNAWGWYRIPLVYGNAIRASKANQSAYYVPDIAENAVTETNGSFLKKFVDHKGSPIYTNSSWSNSKDLSVNKDPYIKNHYTIKGAYIIWQDQDNLINTSVSYDQDYLYFYIPQSTITQGNAMLAVHGGTGNNDDILWSWHIWVTDEDTNNTVAVYNLSHYRYELMPICLGWCSTKEVSDYYPSRSQRVKITQNTLNGAGGAVAYMTIHQNHFFTESNKQGYIPVYQWGRKDPLVAASGNSSSGSTWKVVQAPAGLPVGNGATCAVADGDGGVPNSIAHPNLFIKGVSGTQDVANGDWTTDHYYNLWSARNTSSAISDAIVVKTIYDPCPLGYHIPSPSVFTGFTKDGIPAGTDFNTYPNRPLADYGNTTGTYSNGWTFYCGTNSTSWKTGATLYFTCLNEIFYSSGALANASYSHYWAAVPRSWTGGLHLFTTMNYIDPSHGDGGHRHDRTYGWNVWPVAESIYETNWYENDDPSLLTQ